MKEESDLLTELSQGIEYFIADYNSFVYERFIVGGQGRLTALV
jgi:hypothetical protein